MSLFFTFVTVFNLMDDVQLDRGEIADINMRAAEFAAARARLNILQHNLVDSGFMYDTTRAREEADGNASVGTDAPYGRFHETGTRNMPARPWLIPAIEEAVAMFPVAIKGVVGGQ